MKLLFDHHLSPKLVKRLADLFPNSAHVFPLGMDREDDVAIWEYARINGFVVLTKDEDFDTLAVLRGHPPKLIGIQLGNCTNDEVEAALRARFAEIVSFETDPILGTLIVS